MPKQGATLKSQAQQLVLNVLNYFEREKINGGSLIPLAAVEEHVANAMGISRSSVQRINLQQVKGLKIPIPGKSRLRKKNKTSDLPESSKMNIRYTLYKMYEQKKHVTVSSLNDELHPLNILLSNSSLNRVLHEIGFKFKKEGNRRALIEKLDIANQRIRFMRAYMENENSQFERQLVFLDETLIFSTGNPGRSWQDDSVASVRKPEGCTGNRFIVLHAGTCSGFVRNASLIFASKSQTEDYHGEMNSDMFKKWIVDMLIPNLDEPSLIIMDNALYHSMVVEKMPSTTWTKANIASWLTANNIDYNPLSLKPELLALAKANKKEKRYEVDELLSSCGHEVLRLPPYHCDFNAIELIWSNCKTYYNKHIGRDGYQDDNVIKMWEEALEQCSQEVWSNYIRHTRKLISEWYERERILDVTVPNLIIQLNDCSDSDSSESD